MKAKIQKVELFNIEINGVTHKGFEKIESWRGLACYKNKDGEIIATEYPGDNPIDWVFDMIGGKPTNEDQEVVIISASPCFICLNNAN